MSIETNYPETKDQGTAEQSSQKTEIKSNPEAVSQNDSTDTEGIENSDLKERFENIKKELIEVGGPEKSDDIIEIEQGALDGKFAEFLLKNEDCLAILKQYVKTIKRDGLSKRAGNSLKDLDKFLDDISDTERMKKDYDEFMEKIQNPKKLNSINNRKIRRLNLYLGSHEDEALAAYKAMKPIVGKYFENKMRSKDKEFFEKVWENLKTNYANNDKFFESDFGKLSESSKDLYDLAGNLGIKQWDGRNLSQGDITIGENSIISKKSVMDKFNEANKKRIDNVKSGILSLVAEVKDQLGVKGGKVVIKNSGAELTSEALLSLLSNKEAFKNLPVVENEWNTDHLRNALTEVINSEEIKNGLENLDQMQHDDGNGGEGNGHEGEGDNHEGDDHEGDGEHHETSTNTYKEKKENFKVKLAGLKDKIKELGFYDGNEEGENIDFNMVEIKKYLTTLQEKSRGGLESAEPLERATWTISVQIALNYLAKKNNKPDYNVGYIDGIRGTETVKGVKAFQRDNGLKFRNGQPDGLPGKVTIGKIVELLGGESNDNGEEGNENDDNNEENGENNGDNKQNGNKGNENSENDKTKENPAIKEKIGKFNTNEPILDLSELESLSESDANQILEGIKNKMNGQNLQRPILLKLNGLSSMDNKVAEKLSKFEGGITIDKILNNINFDNCDSEIAMLKTLAPETNEKIKIIAPSQEICNKLKEKGVNNTEVMRAQ